MNDPNFDTALIAAVFQRAADVGWARTTILDAAQSAGLSTAEARARFPSKRALLSRFGSLLDQAALASDSGEGPVRDRLFDLLMTRFDAMKPHRAGIGALLRYLPTDPLTALALTCATERSMCWMLQAVGEPTNGLRGLLRVKGLTAVWTWTTRTFEKDESEDLSATMATLDAALGRVHGMAEWLAGSARPRKVDDDASAEETLSPGA